MKFSFFKPSMDTHLRKSREYLEDAKIKRVEHHRALTQLHAERISRIDAEIKEASQAPSSINQPRPAADIESARPKSDPVLVYPPRASHA